MKAQRHVAAPEAGTAITAELTANGSNFLQPAVWLGRVGERARELAPRRRCPSLRYALLRCTSTVFGVTKRRLRDVAVRLPLGRELGDAALARRQGKRPR